jgi:hypothetical protein
VSSTDDPEHFYIGPSYRDPADLGVIDVAFDDECEDVAYDEGLRRMSESARQGFEEYLKNLGRW